MKALGTFILLFFTVQFSFSQMLYPYKLGYETTENITEVRQTLKANLQQNQITIVGEYQPANDPNRWIMVFTSPELINSVKMVGGKTGFAAALRLAITVENGKTIISYTNPMYWGNAYLREDYSQVQANYSKLNSKIEKSIHASGKFVGSNFGSKKGMEAEDLHDYHYMMGMPYFDDTVELGEFDNHQSALDKVESSIKAGVPGVKMVYKVTIPGKNLTLYGFALSGEKGESQFLPIIDISSPKHTAFLPYEVLVMDDEVIMLHGRYRIAIAFPDLTMGTFSKIMSTPGNIEDLLKQLVE